MEIKEKAYFEVYHDNELIFKGVGENMKFSGIFIKLEYAPKNYSYTSHWGNTFEIPVYIIHYYSDNFKNNSNEKL